MGEKDDLGIAGNYNRVPFCLVGFLSGPCLCQL